MKERFEGFELCYRTTQGPYGKVLEINNAFQRPGKFWKRDIFKMAVEKLWIFVSKILK